MKMKEVTEKTELTERAVRLYIENGLVAPSVNESYSGRRNIEFSDEDVARLKSISVMRKAGFSIAQIKLMQNEPEKSKSVLREFIDSTKQRIETDSEIVACLTPLLSLESLSPEQISRSLEKPVIEEKTIPPEDSEPTALQKFIRKLFLGLGAAGLVFAVLNIAVIIRPDIRDMKGYLYPHITSNSIMLYIWLVLSLVVCVAIILLNRKSNFRTRKGYKIKSAVSLVLVCLCGFATYYNCALAVFTRLDKDSQSSIRSITYDTTDYMILDAPEARDALLEFMPEKISDAEGVKYNYSYIEYGVWNEPPSTVVSLEIPLGEEEFRETVEKYKAFRPSDSVCEPYEKEEGEWTVVYYRENYEHPPTNYTPIFAFNEATYTVRLMCYYGRESMKGAHNAIGDFELAW